MCLYKARTLFFLANAINKKKVWEGKIMGKKFINLEAAVSQILDKVCTKTDEDGYVWVLRRDVVHALDDIPTADVMEVVRCKDCAYYNHTAGFCEHLDTEMLIHDYCSDGYRRIGNG